MRSIKGIKFIYLVNVLIAIFVVNVVLFTTKSVWTTYKSLSKTNDKMEKEYNDILSKYGKAAMLILRNNLPHTLEYFNATADTVFNLFPAEKIRVTDTKQTSGIKKTGEITDNNSSNIKRCYKGKCIEIVANKESILSGLSNSILSKLDKIKKVPIEKSTLFRSSIKKFSDTNKDFIIFILLWLFIFSNFKQTKKYNELLTKKDSANIDLMSKSKALDELYKYSSTIYGMVDEYFTRQAHHLVSRESNYEKVNIPDLLQKITEYLSYQVIKQDIRIIFDEDSNMDFINTDKEILFIVLLNLVFESVSRSKISSEIIIKLFKEQEVINIEIIDVGYGYEEKASKNIKLHILPDPMLENLCRKINITSIEYIKNSKGNTTSVKFASSHIDDAEAKENDAGAIKIKSGDYND